MDKCLKCEEDVSGLVGFNTLCDEFIECPKCGHKMKVEYEESYDPESGEESYWFWVTNYKAKGEA